MEKIEKKILQNMKRLRMAGLTSIWWKEMLLVAWAEDFERMCLRE